jgi:hypothetical protein
VLFCVTIFCMKLYGTYAFDEDFAAAIATALNASYSDKASGHGYDKVFAHLFEGNTVNNFLEIGLFLNELQHTDLNAWTSVFPSANIYGADKKESQLFNSGNIRTHVIDQEVPASFDALKAEFDVEFDVVIDDASHVYANTITTFEALFSTVKTGGIYLIEDIQDDGEGANDWQQTLSQLEAYMTAEGRTYEVFQSLVPEKLICQETLEPTDIDGVSDNYILCVYK